MVDDLRKLIISRYTATKHIDTVHNLYRASVKALRYPGIQFSTLFAHLHVRSTGLLVVVVIGTGGSTWNENNHAISSLSEGLVHNGVRLLFAEKNCGNKKENSILLSHPRKYKFIKIYT